MRLSKVKHQSAGAKASTSEKRASSELRFETTKAITREDMRRDTHRPAQASSAEAKNVLRFNV
jgi:hypothetical protein